MNFCDLRNEVVEHLMRVVDEESLVYRACCSANKRKLKAAVGMAMGVRYFEIKPGTPIAALVGVSDFNPNWRDSLELVEDTLWNELEFYRQCGIVSDLNCPLEALISSRELSNLA